MWTPLTASRDKATMVYYSALKIHPRPAHSQKPAGFIVFVPELSKEMMFKKTYCMKMFQKVNFYHFKLYSL